MRVHDLKLDPAMLFPGYEIADKGSKGCCDGRSEIVWCCSCILQSFIWIFGYVYTRSDRIPLHPNRLNERTHTRDCDETLFCGFSDSEQKETPCCNVRKT